MPYAVSLFFDNETDRAVRAMWQAIADAGISHCLTQGVFHPHLTLAIYAELDIDPAQSALMSLTKSTEHLPIPLPSIGVFLGDEGVVFLAATMTHALLHLHQTVYRMLATCARNPVPYYLPDRWNPHCSLARDLTSEQVAPAITLCRELLPDTLQATLTHIGIVETPVEIEICRIPFERVV